MNQNPFDLTTNSYAVIKTESYPLAILPWGATEPHNFHLPYGTDTILSHCISVDAAIETHRKTGLHCMVLPPVALGQQNPGQWNLPFCLHTRYETQKAILWDIVFSLQKQGFNKLIIINGHGGNSFKPMIRDLAVDFPDFLIATSNYFELDKPTQTKIFEEEEDHAGEMETSLMLYYRPELVDMDAAGEGSSRPFALSSLNQHIAWIPRNWQKISIDTGIGNPRKATRIKGEAFKAIVVDKLSDLFAEMAQDDPYLP